MGTAWGVRKNSSPGGSQGEVVPSRIRRDSDQRVEEGLPHRDKGWCRLLASGLQDLAKIPGLTRGMEGKNFKGPHELGSESTAATPIDWR